jgi:hypothetical protein
MIIMINIGYRNENQINKTEALMSYMIIIDASVSLHLLHTFIIYVKVILFLLQFN